MYDIDEENKEKTKEKINQFLNKQNVYKTNMKAFYIQLGGRKLRTPSCIKRPELYSLGA